MQKLKYAAKLASAENTALPFAVYTSLKEQTILNVPIVKPLLIFVLDGCKKLGANGDVQCVNGRFVFLSNGTKIDMRNIAENDEYFALLIEFDYTDFSCLNYKAVNINVEPYFLGEITPLLEGALQQFIEWAAFAPAELWHIRRQELLQTLFHLGYTQVCSIAGAPSLSAKVHAIISTDLTYDWTMDVITQKLAMSESTIRRKLTAEGTSLQAVKDSARLSFGLHQVQSTFQPINHIAEQCGYLSQSRFTNKFKQLFGVTPSALRKTRLSD